MFGKRHVFRKHEWMNEWESLSRVWCFATPWIIAYQASLSMEFSRQEYWSRLPFPSPGNLSDPGMEPGSSALQTDSLPSERQGKPMFQGSNPCSLYWQTDSYQLCRQGSPKVHFFLNDFYRVFYSFSFLAVLCAFGNLGSPTRDWIWALGSERPES